MNEIVKSYFLRRDNKGKIRIATLNLSEDNNIYFITGETGLFEGKRVERPIITINEGKVKRTPLEQAKLQYNHEIELYLNKGYKNISNLFVYLKYFCYICIVSSFIILGIQGGCFHTILS